MTATQTQRLEALAKANHCRLARSATKAWLKAAPSRRVAWRRLAALLDDPDEHLLGMRVGELVDACQWTGKCATREVLHHAELSPQSTVGGMTARQLKALLLTLRCGSLDQTRTAA